MSVHRPTVSIVINNYNYGSYVRAAIESALDQSYATSEVVVVDDGSTDDSRQVLAQFDARIVTVLKSNGGQASAMNAGFRACRGDWVLFLDSDDLLDTDAVDSIVAELNRSPNPRGVAKVQWRLRVVDERGAAGSRTIPDAARPFPPNESISSAGYGMEDYSPPTSGNAYSRAALDKALPIPEDDYRICADLYLNVVAPLLGGVVSVDRVLGSYRIHGRNSQSVRRVDMAAVRKRILLERWRERDYLRFVAQPPEKLFALSDRMLRMTSLRSDPISHPVAGDTVLGLWREVMHHLWRDGDGRTKRDPSQRVYISCWMTAAAVLPSPMTTAIFQLMMMRHNSQIVPMRTAVRLMRVLRQGKDSSRDHK